MGEYRRVLHLIESARNPLTLPVYVLCLHRATLDRMVADVGYGGPKLGYAFGYPLILIDPDEQEGLRLIRA
jgi:hypothetical protein